jgi:hypothetical protein
LGRKRLGTKILGLTCILTKTSNRFVLDFFLSSSAFFWFFGTFFLKQFERSSQREVVKVWDLYSHQHKQNADVNTVHFAVVIFGTDLNQRLELMSLHFSETIPLIQTFLTPAELHSLCHVSQQILQLITLIRPAINLLLSERILSFLPHPALAQLRASVADVLLSPDLPHGGGDLDDLHHHLPPEPPGWRRKGTLGAERWQRLLTSTRWKTSGAQNSPTIMKIYHAFIADVIAPLVKQYGDSEFYYSKIPLLRTHFPSPHVSCTAPSSSSNNSKKSRRTKRNGVSTQRHTDGRYGHPSGECNVWLPLNHKVWGTNSLYRDSSPWSGEITSTALALDYGEAALFYGNRIPHETVPNHTSITRCSLDFRIIPGSLFEPFYRPQPYNESGGYYEKYTIASS